VPGRALQDADPAIGPPSSARVGAALAALHATPVPGLRVVSVGDRRAAVRRAAELLARVEPAWQPVLARLVDGLEAGSAALSREAVATLHGDLHPRNILVGAAEVDGDGDVDGGGDGSGPGPQLGSQPGHADPPFALIDLDGVHAGPAVLELGAWVADALYRATLGGIAPSVAAPAWRAFLAAHAQASGRQADPALLAWSTAHDLLCKRALRCVANLKPGRWLAVPRLLALADAIVRAGHVDAALEAATSAELPAPVSCAALAEAA
jgi:aminoglycoside phosphotransferase (APT) family kinase protein